MTSRPEASRPGACSRSPWALHNVASLPSSWLHTYEEFIAKNAGQVSQIESTLRSLTYIIPGRFRDAEIASESIHSFVQLLSLYHDTLLQRSASAPGAPSSSPHARYTLFWTRKSPAYRRVAYALQVVQYTELLVEMAAKRRGDRARWRAVALVEALKALCRLLLLRLTRLRPLVSPPLPERYPVASSPEGDAEDDGGALAELMAELGGEDGSRGGDDGGGGGQQRPGGGTRKEWAMPRTGMSLPPLPAAGDISAYLQSRVLTADDIKPATRLLHQLRRPSALTAEVLHILAPLAFALALARQAGAGGRDGKAKGGSRWLPWLLGVGLEVAARQLRDQQGLRTTALEREEWGRRGRAMVWWAMRGPAYEKVVKGIVGGVKRRVPNLVSGILEDYEYLWENYYFSTSP